MDNVEVDIVIVGGGPGGLAAAHAITAAAPHLKVAVYERSTADICSTRRGAGLGLDVNGQKALQAINPDLQDRVLAIASVLHCNKVYKADGTLVAEAKYGQGARKDWADRGYRTPCLLGWSELQQLLAESLPVSVTIHTGMEFDRYECAEESETITAYFKPARAQLCAAAEASDPSDQTTAPDHQEAPASHKLKDSSPPQEAAAFPNQDCKCTAVKAQLLVAADGYFSRVRRQCLADGPPEYGETLVYRARLPASAAAAAGVDMQQSSMFVQDVGRFVLAYPISSGDVVWTVGVQDDKLQEQGLNSAAIRAQLYSSGSSRLGSTTSPSTSTTSPSTSTTSPSTAAAEADTGSNRSPQISRQDYTNLQTQGYSTQETAAGEAAKIRCLQVLSGFWDPILNLVRATPPASLVEHGVYTRSASSMCPECFGKGRVVIIGDAAHPLRPTGQGMNQTLEDAWGLGKALLHNRSSSGGSVGGSGRGSVGSGSGSSSSGGGSGSASSGSSGNDSKQAGWAIHLDALQGFRVKRAQRMRPVLQFTIESGKAAYTAAKAKKLDDPAAAASALGNDTKEMSAAEFSEFCCSVEFEKLSVAA